MIAHAAVPMPSKKLSRMTSLPIDFNFGIKDTVPPLDGGSGVEDWGTSSTPCCPYLFLW